MSTNQNETHTQVIDPLVNLSDEELAQAPRFDADAFRDDLRAIGEERAQAVDASRAASTDFNHLFR